MAAPDPRRLARALADTDRALARYRRRLGAVLRDLRGFAVTEAELDALARDSRGFAGAATRLAEVLPQDVPAARRLRTARVGAKLWHGLIARYADAMRTLAEGPAEREAAVPDFVAQARLRRRFTRAAIAREARLRALAGTLRKARRETGRETGPPDSGADPGRDGGTPPAPGSAGPAA